MDRVKVLELWPNDEFGGPEIDSSYTACRYAKLCFDNSKYINILNFKLNNLKMFIYNFEAFCEEDLEKLEEVTLKCHYINACIRKIIELRIYERYHLSNTLKIGTLCPFCNDKLVNHDELFNCPQ